MQRGPNPYMSDYDFRYTIAQHTALTGNAFVWLNRVMGKIVEMYPLTPGSVTVLDDPKNPDGWSKIYQVTLKDNSVITIPNEDMWAVSLLTMQFISRSLTPVYILTPFEV